MPEGAKRFEASRVTLGVIAAVACVASLISTVSVGAASGFEDTAGSTFESDIDWLAGEGITRGCNPPANTLFCPDDFVTRGQMSAFLHRALDDVLTPGAAVEFDDDNGNTFEADIEWLGATGVTRGCNPPANNLFCPNDFVTRGQMAAFMRRALDPDGGPPGSTTPSTTPGSTSTTAPTTTTTADTPPPGDAIWREVPDGGGPQDRHEAGFVAVGNRLYLIGGRGTRPIQYFDLGTGVWVNTGVSTTNLHHFQPVVIGDDIYIVGALTGTCCTVTTEPPATVVKVFDTATNTLSDTHAILTQFRRGSAGAVVHNGDIYVISGNTGGHGDDGTENLDLFTRYDPFGSPRWTALDPIPHPRDHFAAAMIGNRLFVAGGRTSEVGPITSVAMFAAVVPEVDVYNFNTSSWSTLTMLPSPRAAAATAALNGALYIIGGEGGALSDMGDPAWDRVDRLVPNTDWDTLDSIPVPRHGTGAATCADDIYVAAGAETRGGQDEVNDFHALDTEGDGLDCLTP